MSGDLTPECAAVVGAVLDALGAPAGAEDTRSHAQRYHDALLEAMRRLLAAGLLPERAGPAGPGPGARLAGRPDADRRQLGAAGAVVGRGPRAVGRGPRRRLGHRQRRSRLARRRGRGGVHLRRLGHPGGHRGRQPGRAGGPDPAVHRARPAPPRCRRDRPGRRRRRTRHSGPGRRWRPGHGPGPGRAERRRSSARRWTCCPARAGSPASCAAGSSARGWAGRACRWTSGCPGTSRPRSAARSSCGTSTAGSPAAATSPRPAARCTTSATRPTAGRPASPTAPCSASSTTRSSSTGRAGPSILNPDGTTTAWNKDKTKIIHSHGPPARPG